LASLHDQVSDACDNKGIKEKALRIEVVKLDAKRDAYSQDAQLVSNSYQVADKSIEEKCQG
jgi:hypothetical protein